LAVDDEPQNLDLIKATLSEYGLEILTTEDPSTGLKLFTQHRPPIVLSDLMMPGMTGIELAAASRQVRPSLPILLATGYADLPEGTQLDLPRLAKPYHQDQLRDRLEQLLA
jgi:CheY-like chemotaxis protein